MDTTGPLPVAAIEPAAQRFLPPSPPPFTVPASREATAFPVRRRISRLAGIGLH